MLNNLFKRLFSEPKSECPQGEIERPESILHSFSESKSQRQLVDLDIGLDLGTSCTKAVVGDRESNKQIAVPLNGGKDLKGYLLPTHIYIKDGCYTLEADGASEARRALKIRVMEDAKRGAEPDLKALSDFAAYTALVIRRVIKWYLSDVLEPNSVRCPVWHLNVGLPSKGSSNDQLPSRYVRMLNAASQLAFGDAVISPEIVWACLDNGVNLEALIPKERITTFPESGAQLASILMSPHRQDGCLLVVDVGAGTMDVSTFRIGGDIALARGSRHECEVSPHGVHYLQLARHGFSLGDEIDANLLEQVSEDDGMNSNPRIGGDNEPEAFLEGCRTSIIGVVAQYRRRLKKAHQNGNAYRPWRRGLPYVLSGGGHRDPFYQKMLEVRLREWLSVVVSEWHEIMKTGDHHGLVRKNFPIPRSFEPKELVSDFDRFSVAHGLSLGPDGFMELRDARD